MLSGLESKIEHDTTHIINKFAKKVADEYKIDKDDILKIWKGIITSKKASPKNSLLKKRKHEKGEVKDEIVLTRDDLEGINNANKDVLIGMCKKYGLKVSGKKDELMNRIIEHVKKMDPSMVDNKGVKETPADKKAKTGKKLIKNKEENKKVLKTVSSLTQIIQIKRNRFGNYEHVDSGLVFDRDDQVVIGRQHNEGGIMDLTDDDISLCKKFKFNFKIPENLDKYKKTADVKIKEMEEEELNEDDYKEEELLDESEIEDEEEGEEENY